VIGNEAPGVVAVIKNPVAGWASPVAGGPVGATREAAIAIGVAIGAAIGVAI
jgi:hypothetical protein